MFKKNQEVIYRPMLMKRGLPVPEMRGFVISMDNVKEGYVNVFITTGPKKGRRISVSASALTLVPQKADYQ